MRTLRAYIELARLSNAPTIISNVLVGAAIGLASQQPRGGGVVGDSVPQGPPLVMEDWLTIIAMSIAMLLLYIAGMALNDAIDVKVDRVERPGRPIPSGRVSLQSAYVFASLCMAGGIAIAAFFGEQAALLAGTLVIAIVLYDILHKRFVGAVVLMGLCRGLVYLTVAAAMAWPLEWRIAIPLSLALTLYVIFVTLIARGEASEQGGSPFMVRLSIFLIAIALAPALWIVPEQWGMTVGIALAVIGWLVAAQRFLITQPVRTKRAVMAMLAAICLVDAYYLALLEQPTIAAIAVVCFVLTVVGHQRISGT